jgi:siroheme decarboxylase
MVELDEKSQLLLNVIQDDVAFDERPYKKLGEKIGTSEDETVKIIADLKEKRILRQISAIFDTRSLGYQSSLVAARVPEGKADEVAEIINEHPGVTHNYARRHDFVLWFTIGIPGNSDLNWHIDTLQKKSGALSIRLLPTLRLFKIGMKLDMTDGKAKKMGIDEEAPMYSDAQRALEKPPLTEKDLDYIRALQEDMEVRPDPYAPIVKQLGTTYQELFQWCKDFQSVGRLRRVAGIMNHRIAGFRANGMAVWKVPTERVEEVGTYFGNQQPITHSYLRPTYPDWPYNIFTMVHSKKVTNADDYIKELSQATGISEYAILYSYKEYKKVRLMYFKGDIEAWERANGKNFPGTENYAWALGNAMAK